MTHRLVDFSIAFRYHVALKFLIRIPRLFQDIEVRMNLAAVTVRSVRVRSAIDGRARRRDALVPSLG